jgi:hypothetical protein
VHEGVTQTIGLICAVAATMWAFMRVAEHGRVGDYLLFGLTAGLGLITKYNFAGFLAVLLGSALLQPALRAPLFNWRALLSFAVAALVVSPVVYWLIIEHHDLVALYQSSIAPTAHNHWLQARLDGLVKSVWVPFGFLFPLDVLLLFFPGTLREGWKEIKQAVMPRSWNGAEPDWRLFLLHMTLGGFIVLGLGALVTGATHYLERYMHPFFLLTPLWLLALVETGGKAPRRLAILSTVLVISTIAVIPLRARDLSNTMTGACRKCRIAIPYDGLADALKVRGFQSGTIIAATREDAGNLRRFFPDARIVRLERPRYEPPPRVIKSGDKLAVVWREGYRLTKEAKSEYNAIVQGLGVTPEPVSAALQNGSGTSKRQFEWKVIVVDVPAK